MAALRRGTLHLNASFAQGSTSNNITPGLHSAAASLNPNPIIETGILDTLHAATAPYCVDEPSADSVLPLDLDTIMANVGLANDLDKFPLVTTHHTDDLLPDVTLPQLPSMVHGVALLPEESISDSGGDALVEYSPRSEYSDLADISDLEDDSELFHSEVESTHVERLGQPVENIANPSYTNVEVPPIPPHIPADTTDEQAGISMSPIPPHIRFYESLALDLHGRFGLTRAGVEYMLKSVDWSLGDTEVSSNRDLKARKLKRLLSGREIVLAIRNHKAHLNRPDQDHDAKEDIQHGRIWSEMKGPDGKAFFTPDGDEIGLILALDWFNSTTMVGSRSHLTGIISMAVANLPPELRWNPENLANFLDPLVDELLVLWDTPQTILPIDHEARTIAEHRKAATTYETLRTDTERAEFMRTRTYFGTPGGYRHVALLKLPYWNGAQMVVVDPMHCIFLAEEYMGEVSTHA
ncbi:Transposase family Tnp2 domain-containing protein [Ceratobasidium sp. AG-Ba]|nr:Transposase family Tnp2 domain-containing protein [Ceratobasidium sp. AG-Ba]